MSEKAGKILKYLLSVVLAAVLLYFSFRKVEWRDFIGVLGRCNWLMVGLAMLSGLLSSAVRALRWRLLLQPVGSDRGWWKAFNAVNIGKLTDLVLPHAGEFVRCGYIVSPASPYQKVLGTVLLERSWDIMTLLVLIAALIVSCWEEFGEFFASKIWAPLSGASHARALIIIVTAVVLTALIALVSRKAGHLLKGLWEGFSSFTRMPRKWLFLAGTVLLWVMFLLMCWFIVAALPEDMGFGIKDILFIMLVGCIAGIVPVPGGFGAFHYLVATALLSIYGIPFETGIIFATLSHESQAITTIIAGLGSYVAESSRPYSGRRLT